jgi:hypothetical protein
MDEIERLVASEEIRNLKGRYCRAVDTKDLALMTSVFATDAVADYKDSAIDPVTGKGFQPENLGEPVRGGAVIARNIMDSITGAVTVHHCIMGEIVVESAERARALWPMVDRLRFPQGPFREVIGYGHYHETYVREGGDWKIASVRVSRLRIDFIEA